MVIEFETSGLPLTKRKRVFQVQLKPVRYDVHQFRYSRLIRRQEFAAIPSVEKRAYRYPFHNLMSVFRLMTADLSNVLLSMKRTALLE